MIIQIQGQQRDVEQVANDLSNIVDIKPRKNGEKTSERGEAISFVADIIQIGTAIILIYQWYQEQKKNGKPKQKNNDESTGNILDKVTIILIKKDGTGLELKMNVTEEEIREFIEDQE
jgi:hypothetical protein